MLDQILRKLSILVQKLRGLRNPSFLLTMLVVLEGKKTTWGKTEKTLNKGGEDWFR